jgi:RHS repeat-associated protein
VKILGVVRIYRGRAGIVEKIVLIGIVVLVMMAPFRYSQASRGVVFYYHNDHLNTPVKMSDEKGNIVWEVVSKHPFGSFEVSSKEVVLSDYTGNSNDSFNYKIENPLRFPGQYDDSDTKDVRSIILNNAEGLYYNYHRWYNPDTGRYMEVDPLLYGELPLAICKKLVIVSLEILKDFDRHSYIYTKSKPIDLYDVYGLQYPYPIPIIPGWFARCYISGIYTVVDVGWLNPAGGDPDENYMRHCLASCKLARRSDKLCSLVLGWLNEINPWGVYDPADVDANKKGLKCSNDPDCRICCKCSFYS